MRIMYWSSDVCSSGLAVCLPPKDRKGTLERPTPKALFPGLTPARVAQISRYYEFRDIGEARIAGRICRGTTIEPRDQYRYGYEIWADAETAVPVKVDLIGRGNRVMEQLMFTAIEFQKTIHDSALQPELDTAKFQRVTRLVQEPKPFNVDREADAQFAYRQPCSHVAIRDVRPTR